jgi:hypothetical protein
MTKSFSGARPIVTPSGFRTKRRGPPGALTLSRHEITEAGGIGPGFLLRNKTNRLVSRTKSNKRNRRTIPTRRPRCLKSVLALSSGEAAGVGVGVGLVRVGRGVEVAVWLGVGVGVWPGVEVTVWLGVGVGVWLGVEVAVWLGVGVGVWPGVEVVVWLGGGVRIGLVASAGVNVGVGVGSAMASDCGGGEARSGAAIPNVKNNTNPSAKGNFVTAIVLPFRLCLLQRYQSFVITD